MLWYCIGLTVTLTLTLTQSSPQTIARSGTQSLLKLQSMGRAIRAPVVWSIVSARVMSPVFVAGLCPLYCDYTRNDRSGPVV